MAGALAPTGWFWLLFFTAVPFCWCSWRNARHLPHGRSQAGDRHLKFYETRDNLSKVRQRESDDPYSVFHTCRVCSCLPSARWLVAHHPGHNARNSRVFRPNAVSQLVQGCGAWPSAKASRSVAGCGLSVSVARWRPFGVRASGLVEMWQTVIALLFRLARRCRCSDARHGKESRCPDSGTQGGDVADVHESVCFSWHDAGAWTPRHGRTVDAETRHAGRRCDRRP